MSDVITLTLLRLRSAPNPLQSSWRVVSDMMVDLLLSPTIQVSIRDYFGRYLESRSRRVESSRVVVESIRPALASAACRTDTGIVPVKYD
jgi:hypothetical protein